MKQRTRAMVSAVGEQSGKLTVIGDVFTLNDKRKRHVLCECKCGNLRVCQLNNIRSKNSRSCGCQKGNDPVKKPHGEAAARSLYGNYKRGAMKRSLPFALSFEQFIAITSQECFHCGIEPLQEIVVRYPSGKLKGQSRLNGSYTYNGIDRLNNDAGYIYDNCVTSCFTCNLMKWKLSVSEFHAWIKRVYERTLINETKMPFSKQR